MTSTEENSIKDNQIDYSKRYRIISKIFIVLELLLFLFVNTLIRCACGIPTFNAIPPIIVFIINVIFYFITRNRVDTKKELKSYLRTMSKTPSLSRTLSLCICIISMLAKM